MNKSILLVVCTAILLPMVLADLQITPPSFDGTVYVGRTYTLEIELKNTYNYAIYGINFTAMSDVTTPFIDSLNINESKKVNITILTSESFSKKTMNSVVKFWYYSAINIAPVTYDINITPQGFSPTERRIQIGDSIRFINQGNLTVVVKDEKNYFDRIVSVNQSIIVPQGTDRPFSAIDEFFYHDMNDITKVGKIIVQNITRELVTNPELNKIFTVAFDSRYTDSDLAIEIYPQNNMTVEYNGFQEFNVRVWNRANTTAHNVTLSADDETSWFKFSENGFDLTKDQNRFITVRVTPDINTTEETNRTYDIDIVARAENAGAVSATLRIFVPFAEQIRRIYYGEDFWRQREIYCKAHPEDIACNPPPKVEKVIEYKYLNSTIEYSKEEALLNDRQQNTRLTSIEDNQVKQTKSINDMLSSILDMKNSQNNMTQQINSYNSISKNSQKSASDQLTTILMVVSLILLVGIGGVILWNVRKKMEAEASQHM